MLRAFLILCIIIVSSAGCGSDDSKPPSSTQAAGFFVTYDDLCSILKRLAVVNNLGPNANRSALPPDLTANNCARLFTAIR